MPTSTLNDHESGHASGGQGSLQSNRALSSTETEPSVERPKEPITQDTIDNSPQVRHILQVVMDLNRKPLTGLRVLDLACSAGGYSLEMAALGAQVVGIEGRAEWLRQAAEKKQRNGFENIEFLQDDVRNLSKKKYGEFDIVLCLGILYHLDAPDVFDLIGRISEVCRDFAVFETHYATLEQSYRSYDWRGHRYLGASYMEHDPNATHEEKLAALGASLDNQYAFWFTKPSLLNILRHVGFSSVYEVRNPVPNVFVGPDDQVKIWGNRCTLAAIKGQPVKMLEYPKAAPEVDWPENLAEHCLEDILTHARPLPTA